MRNVARKVSHAHFYSVARIFACLDSVPGHTEGPHDVAVVVDDVLWYGRVSRDQTVDDCVLARDPFCGGDQKAEGQNEDGRASVVSPLDQSFRLRLAKLLLVEDWDVVPDGGKYPHNASHCDGLTPLRQYYGLQNIEVQNFKKKHLHNMCVLLI